MWARFRRRLALLICPELARPSSADWPGGTAGLECGPPVVLARRRDDLSMEVR